MLTRRRHAHAGGQGAARHVPCNALDDLLRHVLGPCSTRYQGWRACLIPCRGAVSRFCASGLDAVALAASRIRLGDDTHGHAAAWSAPQEAAIWHGHHVHVHVHVHGRGRDI